MRLMGGIEGAAEQPDALPGGGAVGCEIARGARVSFGAAGDGTVSASGLADPCARDAIAGHDPRASPARYDA